MFTSRFTALLTTTTLAALPAAAQTPNVVTDIAPVASLTAHVMGDLGTPRNLIKPGASPHDYALRPSDARALRDADVVFWIGGALTPWLEAPLETLSKNAEHVSLLNAEATKLIEPRDLGHDHHDHGADKHDEHDDHDHDKEHTDDEHDHEKEHAKNMQNMAMKSTITQMHRAILLIHTRGLTQTMPLRG
jgi:zinc transport system substrate-binding protein